MADVVRGRTALLISYSNLERDPRVRRQAEWLAADGWTVDTLGLGPHPAPEVREHVELLPQPRWVRSAIGRVLNYGLLPPAARFRNLMRRRVPDRLATRIGAGGYDLVVFEDYDFLPLLADASVFTPRALERRIHLDLHEYRDARLRLDSLRRRLNDRYYRWRRGMIGHPAIDTRTTVASAIAELYAADFGFPPPPVVRNCPPFVELRPRPVDAGRIRLLFHGMASWSRGFQELLAALERLDDRFTVTFMLTPNGSVIDELRRRIEPYGERVQIIPPVPMADVARAVNGFDLEVMFYQPTQANLEFALPNKFFEAIQGRVGLVVGRSPMMAEIVETFGNGVVVDGWSAEDLARSLASLTPERIDALKAASDRAARVLNAETEGAAFLAGIAGGS